MSGFGFPARGLVQAPAGRRLGLAAVGGAAVLGGAVGVATVAVSPLAPIGALLGLVGAGAVLRAPLTALLAFVLTACVLPFAVIPVRVGLALTLVDVALTSLLLVWVLRALRRREPLVTSPIDGLLGLFIGMAIVSFVLGAGYAAVEGEQFRLFLKLINSLLVFFGALQVVRTEADLTRVLRALMVGGGLAAAIAIGLYLLPRETAVQLLSGLRPLGYPSGPEVIRVIAGTETVRAIGTSIDPNVLGGLLMVVGVLLGASVGSGRGSGELLPRPLALVLLGLTLVAVVLTYSRSSWVGLAAGLGFIAGFRDRRVWLLVGVGLAAVVLLPPGQVLLDRLASGVQARDQAAAMRLGEYKDALELITRYPVLGVGFGEAPTIELYVAVSSIYLLIAEEMGLVGLGIFLAMMGVALARSFRPPGAPGVVVGLQGALVAALVAGLFDHYFFNLRFPHMVALFWLLVALLLIAVRLQDQRV